MRVLRAIHGYTSCFWPRLFADQQRQWGCETVIFVRTIRLSRGWIRSQQRDGRWVVKCLYRETLVGLNDCVTTSVKGASSPGMYIDGTKRRSRGEGAGHAGWEFWPAVKRRIGQGAFVRRRVLESWVPCRALGAKLWRGRGAVDWP